MGALRNDAFEPDRTGRRRLWTALAAGVVLVGLAALFPSVEAPPEAAAPFTFAPLSAAPTLGEIVPGWEDTIVLVAGAVESGDLVSMIWRASDAAASRGVSFTARAVAHDVSGAWLATMSEEAGELVLRSGPSEGPLSDIAQGVTGFAWHRDDAGRLAWSEADGRTTTLDLGSGVTGVRDTGPGRLVAWGGGGLVFELAAGASRVVADSGVARVVDGGYIGHVWGGSAFIRDDADPGSSALFLVTPDATATARVDGVGDGRTLRVLGNPVQAGVIAVAAETTNAAGASSAEVLVVDQGGERRHVVGSVTVSPTMTWTSGGRWLVVVGAADTGPTLMFHDLVAATTTVVSLGADALGLAPGEEGFEIVALGVRTTG